MRIDDFVESWSTIFPGQNGRKPWEVVAILDDILCDLPGSGIHVAESATVEDGAVMKSPSWIGPGCFIAATAYLRGGTWLEQDCIIGPACELKTTIMFAEAKIAHLSFVGDSIIGARANIEAGAIIANYRNEMRDKQIRIAADDAIIDTGTDKFGALLGDDARVGANAVIAPGALIDKSAVISRMALIDQHPSAI